MMHSLQIILFVFLLFPLLAMAKSKGSRALSYRRFPKNASIQKNQNEMKNKLQLIATTEFSPEVRSKQLLAKSSILLCSMIYGFSYIVTKNLQEKLSPELINVLRFSLATVCFIPEMIQTKFSFILLRIGFELGFLCSLGFMTQSIAITMASTSKAALFTSLTVVIPPVLDVIESKLFKSTDQLGDGKQKGLWQRLRQSKFTAAFLAFFGAVVVECGDVETPHLRDLLLLVTPLSFALCFWRSEKYAARYKLPAKAVTGFMMLFSTLFFALWAAFHSQLPVNVGDWNEIWLALCSKPILFLNLLFLSLFATAYTAISEQHSFHVISATEASIIYSTEPIFATLFSYLFLNEKIGWNIFIGSIFTILASVIH